MRVQYLKYNALSKEKNKTHVLLGKACEVLKENMVEECLCKGREEKPERCGQFPGKEADSGLSMHCTGGWPRSGAAGSRER